jgi:serine/threonine protein kinase
VLKTEVNSTAFVDESVQRENLPLNLSEIAGYALKERIGVGGFGEVWKAVGPGGFSKAVKILFGNLSGPQAETELRSLNRMRDLRHPFLLNVERVESIDGRVVIVTELADRSLEDRFRQVLASGQKGIPRDELLQYLRDAADALDFMSEQHGLQHLDIKPDNLLLQGSHAKVGDFGLTKSLSQTGHSLVNGFTPLYAPPELFDGRPERSSDQYSLAIVYQMMLTGVPPFNGRSAAQLTSQHLKSPPDLTVLHPSDRSVVARALSKNPRTRFPSCRQFVDELSKRRYANSSLPRVPEAVEAPAVSPLTHFVEEGVNGISNSRLLPPATPLRPPGTQGLTWFVRPTVFVGLGGTGCKTMALLRDRLARSYPSSSLPMMRFLCIDADTDLINQIKRRSDASESAAAGIETLTAVAIPLKTSHEYRKAPGDHLNWLSRRWLFNIPRSGKVEGMRPLGRLAFVDHQDEILQQFQKTLDQIFQTDAVEQTQRETQLPCSRDGIDIVLVGSTSGGTCSGSLMDAAWLFRSLITDRRLPPSNFSAVLLHGTGNGGQLADMQDANTICFLKELNYFSLPGSSRPAGNNRAAGNLRSEMALDEVVLLHLGDDLTNLDFQAGLENVVDYLEMRSVTPARLELDSWRIATQAQNDHRGELQLRTFGISKVACDSWNVANSESNAICASMIQHWLSRKSATEGSSSSQLPPALSALIQELALTSEGIIELLPRLLNADRSRRVDEYASAVWSRLGLMTSAADVPGMVASLINEETSAPQKSAIAVVIEETRRDLSAGLSQSIGKTIAYIQNCLDGRGRIAGCEHAVSAMIGAIDAAVTVASRQRSDLQGAFTELCNTFGKSSSPTVQDGSSIKGFCRQYCMLLVCQTVCQNVAVHLKTLRDTLTKFQGEQLPLLKQRLTALASQLGTTLSAQTVPVQMLTAFDESLQRNARFKLSSLLQHDIRPADGQLLSGEATNFMFQSLGKSTTAAPEVAPVMTTSAFPASARPFLRNVGGGQRVLAAVPEIVASEPWKAQLQNEFGPCVSVCPMQRTDISVLCETEGITTATIVDILSNLKPKVVELSGRVHSRQDIPW